MTWFHGRGPGARKYANKPIKDDPAAPGLRFDSTGEFKRWCELKLLERAGNIHNLKRQISYDLDVNGQHICRYVADFQYWESNLLAQAPVVEDFKSPATMSPIFAIKRKLMKACHGIDVRVTGKGVK